MLIVFGEAGPTSRQTTDPYTFLLQTDLPQQVDAVRRALEDTRIPYRTGLMAGSAPTVVFSVPDWQLDDARLAASAVFDFEAARREQKFPWGAVQVVSSLIAVHFALVFGMIASGSSGRQLIVYGALLKGGTLDEPWRLLTSLIVHIDPLHVFWNGASMLAFAVPLITDLGYLRSCMIYLASGVGGGVMALAFAGPGTLIAGSSGAVAGLFGAWVVLQTRRDRLAPLTGRARIRTIGIAMLVLPSLVSPMTSTGHSVSVSSHLGGLATGMAIGALISSRLLGRIRADR